jgi:hypothetical protein
VLAVASDGTSAEAELAIEALAEDEGSSAVEDGAACLVGGSSFTAGTRVLLADGKAVPIASLVPGELVLATNTATGKTSPEPVAAVLVHHDTDLYDLRVKSGGRVSVIDTTSNHLFWAPSLNKFLPASNLKPGTHLKTPDGQSAVVVGGSVPAVHDGWMWDLSVPGNNDHDFYVQTATTAVLVHNCSPGEITGYTRHGLNQAISRDGVGVSPSAINDAVSNPISVAEQTGGKLKYTGQNAAVILSSTGRVISTWARNSAGWRIVRG